MKLTIRKTAEVIIDTSIERRRIKKAFRDDPETKDKLNHLMDLVEACDWKGANNELKSKWWKGRDKRQECPRLEFVGLIAHNSPFFDPMASYADLVWAMCHRYNNYEVIATEQTV